MSDWSQADIDNTLKEEYDALTILANQQRDDMRGTSKCLTQISNLKQVIDTVTTNPDKTTTITWKNPENPAGDTMESNHRDDLVIALIANIIVYRAKF